MIPASESLSVIEKFFEEPLTEEVIGRVRSMPDYQFEVLCTHLDFHFQYWYKRRFRSAGTDKEGSILPAFMPIYSSIHPVSFQESRTVSYELIRWIKCSLLYFPGRIEVPDPISFYSLTAHSETQHDYRHRHTIYLEERRQEVSQGLRMLHTLRPLIDHGSVETIPIASMDQLSDDAFMLVHANSDSEDLASFGVAGIQEQLIELEEMKSHLFELHKDDDLYSRQSLYNPWDVTANWLWIGLCLGNSPVAADSGAITTLERDFDVSLPTAMQDQRVARLISSFPIPGADNATLSDVVRMRLNEEAFHEFRESFSRILKAVIEADPRDGLVFSREFQRHSYDELDARRAHVAQNTRTSDILRQMLAGVFLLGAAGIEAVVTHDAPVGTLLGGTAAGGGWLIPYLMKRSKEKKTDELTRMFFSSLVRGTDRRS